jgi:membrane associated rhomboid family serine protease
MLIPYHVDVPMHRVPWMNWVLIAVTVIFYPLCVDDFLHGTLSELGEELALGVGTSWLGIIGHVLVHAGIIHLTGNMLFLWVFGNAVCAKVGNIAYPFIYFGLGATSGLVAFMIDPRPSVGASGAINGIVGMFLAWYLLNEISCLYSVWYTGGSVQIGSYWIILAFLAFDLIGAARGKGNVGYVAHVVGLVLGFGLAITLQLVGWIRMEKDEKSLLQMLSWHQSPRHKKVRFAKRPSPGDFRGSRRNEPQRHRGTEKKDA